MRTQLILATMIVLASAVVNAGQPWYGSETGEPYHWQNGIIEWVNDPGDLAASVTNADAVKWVQESFDKWAKAGLQNSAAGGLITTVDLHPSKKGTLQQVLSMDPKSDVYYYKIITNNNMYPTIVFDTKGEIIADLCKKLGCDASQIMAYTMVDAQGDLDPKTHTIKHGVTILNGAMINTPNIDNERYKASVIHEIGHLLGLDHSGLNDGYATKVDSKLNRTPTTNMELGLPTMYPVNLHKDQNSLHNDDIMAISTLYPSTTFTSQFCSLTGNVTDGNGVGIQGVEIVVRTATAADYATDSYSTMTGVNYAIPTHDGHYYVYGLVPGKKYSVGLTQLPMFASDGSGIGRFGAETGIAPPTFTISCEGLDAKYCDAAGRDISAGGGATYDVSCDKGGQIIVMDTVSLGAVTMDVKYSTAPTPAGSEPAPPAAASSGKSGCTLIR